MALRPARVLVVSTAVLSAVGARARPLPAGPYRATLTAKDEAGNASASRRVKFTNLRPA